MRGGVSRGKGGGGGGKGRGKERGGEEGKGEGRGGEEKRGRGERGEVVCQAAPTMSGVASLMPMSIVKHLCNVTSSAPLPWASPAPSRLPGGTTQEPGGASRPARSLKEGGVAADDDTSCECGQGAAKD